MWRNTCSKWHCNHGPEFPEVRLRGRPQPDHEVLVVTHIDCGSVSAALARVGVEIVRGVVTVQVIPVIGPCYVALLQAHVAALSEALVNRTTLHLRYPAYVG